MPRKGRCSSPAWSEGLAAAWTRRVPARRCRARLHRPHTRGRSLPPSGSGRRCRCRETVRASFPRSFSVADPDAGPLLQAVRFSVESTLLPANAVQNNPDGTVASCSQELKGRRTGDAGAGIKLVTQHSPGPVQADLYVLLVDLQALRCFGSAEAFNLAQHEDGTILLRERFYGRLEEHAGLRLAGAGFGA